MILPSWATHLAIDEDGEVTVFDSAPVFVPPDNELSGMWALPNPVAGTFSILKPAVRPLASVYPVALAQRLLFTLDGLPPWTTHVAIDAGGEVCAYDSPPVWKGIVRMWTQSSHMGRCATIDHVGTLDALVARTLCFAISAPSTEEGDA